MAPPPQPLPHAVIYPFMAQGHTIPLLDFSKALSRRGLRVTILTTPANSSFILQSISHHPNILLHELDFPIVDGLPKGCENTDRLPSMDLYVPFLRATRQLRRPFHRFLSQLSDLRDLPIFVVSDFFLGWTLAVCREFEVPRLVFHGMGAFSMAVCKSTIVHAPHKHAETFAMPCLPERLKFSVVDLPGEVRDFDPESNPICRFLVEIGESDIESWGVVVNSSVELEGDFVGPLESFYRNGAKAWYLGPMLLYNDEEDQGTCVEGEPTCIEWLNQRATGSVIYVSFGTQTHVSDEQLDEVAMGLERSGCSFVWAIRSKTWCPTKGMEERIKGRGLMVRGWAPQRRILGHHAIGGFMSHCGWNSVLESLSMGVPILAWPMIAEQHLNAKLVEEEFGAGVRIPSVGLEAIIGWATICKGVKELMGGEDGRRARERAQELGQVARRATQDGGSSEKSLDELIKQLTSHGKC
ncbi:UDP-glycosyltransferase 73B4-like protein [Cinnamomum micranthum f. kanehirae]|uniref:Glycosyltransferase n=1 Tax=Cinnamomum micranthum f. kanehirae TaxID=337451 RepID=A0A443PKP4_9MAGN|nr:UDP-glycosyltransferase 73B4-like protein [Cinnamomum micranthum f. kanehirae]